MDFCLELEKPVIVTTDKNICGRNIRKNLLEKWPFKETKEFFDDKPIYKYEHIRLIESKKDVIYADHLNSLDADLFIFGSRHQSQANKKSLLTHVTGNLSKDNSHGGNPLELSFASTRAIREAYLSLLEEKKKQELLEFDVTVEATHHGPTNLNAPVIYIEVGSTDLEYNNKKAVSAVANTIIKVCSGDNTEEIIPSICFGGGHYATRFNELMELTNVAIGHILPKYHRKNLTTSIVEQMIEKTIEQTKWAIIDRNSLNASLVKIIENGCSTSKVEVVKARDIKYSKNK